MNLKALNQGIFTQRPGRESLGSSLSSDTPQRHLRICHKATEDSVGDAPLEAPQRLLTGFALRHLLAVVGSTSGVGPGLAGGYPMCRALC